jgi:predicted enzyme related to lactoylglutathione lyase
MGGGKLITSGVVGAIIWTDNLERLLNFYRDTLELKPNSHQSNFVSFATGETRLGIGIHSEVSGQTRDPYRIMLNLGVDEINESYELLKTRGVQFVRPPEKEHWGGWVATFLDPDGNIIQLMQM